MTQQMHNAIRYLAEYPFRTFLEAADKFDVNVTIKKEMR